MHDSAAIRQCSQPQVVVQDAMRGVSNGSADLIMPPPRHRCSNQLWSASTALKLPLYCWYRPKYPMARQFRVREQRPGNYGRWTKLEDDIAMFEGSAPLHSWVQYASC